MLQVFAAGDLVVEQLGSGCQIGVGKGLLARPEEEGAVSQTPRPHLPSPSCGSSTKSPLLTIS
jgi:hypothetical protein